LELFFTIFCQGPSEICPPDTGLFFPFPCAHPPDPTFFPLPICVAVPLFLGFPVVPFLPTLLVFQEPPEFFSCCAPSPSRLGYTLRLLGSFFTIDQFVFSSLRVPPLLPKCAQGGCSPPASRGCEPRGVSGLPRFVSLVVFCCKGIPYFFALLVVCCSFLSDSPPWRTIAFFPSKTKPRRLKQRCRGDLFFFPGTTRLWFFPCLAPNWLIPDSVPDSTYTFFYAPNCPTPSIFCFSFFHSKVVVQNVWAIVFFFG